MARFRSPSRAQGALAALVAIACGKAEPTGSGSGVAAPMQRVAHLAAAPAAREAPSVPLLSLLDGCDLQREGLILDLGDPSVEARMGFDFVLSDAIVHREHRGAALAEVVARTLTFDVWLTRPSDGIEVAIRGRLLGAKRVTAIIDERSLGNVRLPSDALGVAAVTLRGAVLGAGRHRLTLRFDGTREVAPEGRAWIDWVRIGPPLGDPGRVAAPTRKDSVAELELEGRAHRGIALAAPGLLRCPLLLNPGTKLELDLGYWGAGSGTAEFRLVRDAGEPTLLGQHQVAGGSGAKWEHVEFSLGDHAGEPVALEVRALDSTAGGRIFLGEPELVDGRPLPDGTPSADLAVVVIAAGLDRAQIPPWGPIGELATMADLSREAAAFSGYRAVSTVPGAVVASLLTGRSPLWHGVMDPAARLPESAELLPQRVKAAGGAAAFFTGVPTSFAAFGFGRGWDTYREFSPVSDEAATAPIDAAVDWLEADLKAHGQRKRLLVIHLRGGHPPWDVSREVEAELPPPEYGGALVARRGGIALNERRRQRFHTELGPDDWARFDALRSVALKRQDDGLGHLVAALDELGLEEGALLIVLGDVAVGEPRGVPLDPIGHLEEGRVQAPLLVRFPRSMAGGQRSLATVGTQDVTRTIAVALGLPASDGLEGEDLGVLVTEEPGPLRRISLATLPHRYSVQVLGWRLAGTLGKVPTLCNTSVDPACQQDLFGERPVTAQAIWMATHATVRGLRGGSLVGPAREPAALDPGTAAALTVWGALP